ncbi:MAG: AsnC family transcriptional regulator [Candidatus Aminicenantes bacterium]|nr:AsnC family transcriptional regulator [Candidatus Aminicenantes bacterium]
MSNAEIARRLGVSEGAIRYRLRRQAQGRNSPGSIDNPCPST